VLVANCSRVLYCHFCRVASASLKIEIHAIDIRTVYRECFYPGARRYAGPIIRYCRTARISGADRLCVRGPVEGGMVLAANNPGAAPAMRSQPIPVDVDCYGLSSESLG
jgi:hypothetical protein